MIRYNVERAADKFITPLFELSLSHKFIFKCLIKGNLDSEDDSNIKSYTLSILIIVTLFLTSWSNTII